ncbi:MAG: hypothetical protein MN733_25125, partial [Nitrososphaera sp.]|nr:hypothetical protein [Nitrososphaera sp.]
MSPDDRCPSCQELIPSPETDATTDHVLETQPESFLGESAGTHSHDKCSDRRPDRSGSRSAAHKIESEIVRPEGNAEQLLVKAIKLEAKGRYEESCRLYQQILNDFPRTDVAKDARTRFNNLRKDIEGGEQNAPATRFEALPESLWKDYFIATAGFFFVCFVAGAAFSERHAGFTVLSLVVGAILWKHLNNVRLTRRSVAKRVVLSDEGIEAWSFSGRYVRVPWVTI